jgi:hypothetical protein
MRRANESRCLLWEKEKSLEWERGQAVQKGGGGEQLAAHRTAAPQK